MVLISSLISHAMRFVLTSIARKVLDLNSIESVTLPTKQGEITVLPDHMPLIAALSPGVMVVRFDGQESSYAIGGGVLEISPDTLTVAADMVEEGEMINLDLVREKKEEARAMLEAFRSSKDTIDMDRYIEIEYEYLKESAKEQLATK